MARRKADRLTAPIITEYAAALGMRPFDADVYAPDGVATIVEAHGRRSPISKDVTLARVQRRLAEGWHAIPDYEDPPLLT